MRFSIRDLLWLTAFVAVGIVWLMDRDKVRNERESMVKREAELTSQAKMWQAEADRAGLRWAAIQNEMQAIEMNLRKRRMNIAEFIKYPAFRPPRMGDPPAIGSIRDIEHVQAVR